MALISSFTRQKPLPLVSLLILLMGAWLLATAVAHSETPPAAINVRVGIHQDFERLVFDWPRVVAYKIHRDGQHLTVHFTAAGRPNLRKSQASHLNRIKDVSFGSDPKGFLVVSFSVIKDARVEVFASGHSIVIDVKGSVPAKESEEKTASPALVLPPTADKPKVEAAAPQAPPPETQNMPRSTYPPTKDSVSASGVALPSMPKKEEMAPPPAADPAPPKVDKAPVVTEEPKAALPPATKSKAMSAQDFGSAAELVASLDPHTPTHAAIFQRGGFGYIVFDSKLTLNLAALTAGQPAPLADLKALDLTRGSGWQFSVPPDIELKAEREGTVWHIFVSKQNIEVPVSSSLVAQPDFALGARFLLPLADVPQPVPFTDPVVGDTLMLVPLGTKEVFSVARTMADFKILPAAQGLVIEPLTDSLVVRAVEDGVEITAEGGLHLSPASDTGANRETTQKIKAEAAGKSLFDFTTWAGKPNETFTETRQRLQQTIVDVQEAERNRARLELAHFYFARGNGEEASSLLHMLILQLPDLTTHPDFLALTGATKILAYQAEEGLSDLDSIELKSQPEIELWQGVGNADLRNWQVAEEKFSVSQAVLAGYPEPFYSSFSILSVEAALAAGKEKEAKDWLDRFENSPHRPELDPAIEYLHGVIDSQEGRAQAAEELWHEVTESNDRLYRVRAELALIDLDVATGALTPQKAADRLEALRFGWRGDDLELDILYRLGQFYVDAKNIKSGLNAMNEAIRLYPKSPMVPQIRSEMAKIFHDVFLGELAPNLSAVDALTLFQEYRDLMPTGKDGDLVMRNLAERLVAIDLLDQAAGLLEDLVKTHLQGVDKGRAGARLAAIRLLDHKPDQALAALDESNDNSYPADLLAQRQLLRAKSLSELNKSDDALELLKADDSKDARMLRADIMMHAQRWNDAAKNLILLIGPPPKAGETLTVQQADWLVSCAIALSLGNDQSDLGRLAIDFSASMAVMPQNDTFRVLTQPEKSTQIKDISAVQAKISEVDLFRGFLNAYRSAPDTPAPDAHPALVVPAPQTSQATVPTEATAKP